jgi:NADH:ubiquinone oxidoreductase subunit 6 (subunit J)
MMSARVRQALVILSILIMLGSVVLFGLGLATTIYFDAKQSVPASDSSFSVVAETLFDDFVVILMAGSVLRVLLSIDARLDRKV